MKATTIEALAKVLTYAKSHDTFYAADVGLSGAQVSALKYLGREEDYSRPAICIIEPTGNTREVWFNVDEDTRKRGEVCEWKLSADVYPDGYGWSGGNVREDVEDWHKFLMAKISRLRTEAEEMAKACREVEALLGE